MEIRKRSENFQGVRKFAFSRCVAILGGDNFLGG